MKKNVFILCLMSIIIFSCEKEGPVGPPGPAGKDGTDGKDGNANVTSITKSIAPSDWQASGISGEDLYFYYEISISEITNDIVQKGAVMIYIKQADGSYHALPTTYNFYSSFLGYYYHTTIRYSFNTGKARIEIEDSDMNTYRPEVSLEFKIVIIAGITLKSLSIDLTNYQDVKKCFDL